MQQSAGRVRNGGQRPVWQGPDGCGTGDRDRFGRGRTDAERGTETRSGFCCAFSRFWEGPEISGNMR